MADALDLKVSRRLQKLIRRVSTLVDKEIGQHMGVVLVVFPWREHPGEPADRKLAEYQYASNAPRAHMHGCFKAIVAKWDAGGVDIPPHERQ